MASPGIGRGLAAILPASLAGEEIGDLCELRTDLIKPNPNQPRKRFDAESLSDVYGPQPMLEMLQTTGFPE